MKSRAEVCVVGGGPAGSAVANRLAAMGHDVLLLEAKVFPWSPVAHSLPPGIIPVLEKLGVRREVEEAGFLRPSSALVRWASEEFHHRYEAEYKGFLIDRCVFDQLLLKAAARAGARVLQPGKVLEIIRQGERAWQLFASTCTGDIEIHANFVVDACGRRGILPRRMRRLSAPTIALCGRWREVRITDEQTRVEAGVDRWYWAAPSSEGYWDATVFASPATLKGNNDASLEDVYRRLLSESVMLSDIIFGRSVNGVRACNASSVADDRPCGSDWLKVGESALAIDPLSSQGVQTAIVQSLTAACVVHTLLTRHDASGVALAFYLERLQEASVHHVETAGSQYHAQHIMTPNSFWADRARRPSNLQTPHETRAGSPPRLDQLVFRSPETVLSATPVLNGELISTAVAVSHPFLTRRVAFLGDIPVAALLEDWERPCTVDQLLRHWSTHLPLVKASSLFEWLWRNWIVDEIRT